MATDQFVKDLATGSYDLVVLDILRDRPAYGYEIVRRVFEQSRRTVRWRQTTVSRVLRHLETQGFVVSQWRKAGKCRERKYYRLTVRGQRAWRTRRDQWHSFSTLLNALLNARPHASASRNRRDRR
ncbi:MAG: PadR family transcriptional regulator [Verrucomicrobiia bacterium]